MEYASVGTASRDRLYVQHNGRIATFHGDIVGDSTFAVFVNDIEWYPGQPTTIQERIELMTEANMMPQGDIQLIFIEEYNMIMFDWKGKPFLYIEDGRIKGVKMPCVCGALTEIDGFNNTEEYDRFLTYLNGLLALNMLSKKRMFKRYQGYHAKKYQCPKCKQEWVLVEPNSWAKGLWKLF